MCRDGDTFVGESHTYPPVLPRTRRGNASGTGLFSLSSLGEERAGVRWGRFRPDDPGPWCGARRGARGAAWRDEPRNIPPAERHDARRNPQDRSQPGARALHRRQAAQGTARGRRCGHRRRRHHRRDHRPHPGRGRRLLALRRRTLRQGHARPHAQAAGGRPHAQDVDAGVRRASARPDGARAHREPAGDGVCHHGASRQGPGSLSRRRSLRGSPSC